VFLATKFGITRPENQGSWGLRADGRPQTVRRSIEGSLRRLNVDYVDLYYQHRIDKEVPVEETVGAMAELVREGKIRYVGLSEPNAATIRRAHAVHTRPSVAL
jgi:aryl-alcohol dehydrogenase-like predicted oxidoreductase